MKIRFPYDEKRSDIFPKIKRPVADVFFWSKLFNRWLGYRMIVDTGADYTVLPKYRAVDLDVDFKNDCLIRETSGVGGKSIVYFVKKKIRIMIADKELSIPLGFLDSNNIPPLLGREECLNIFKLVFFNFETEISS